MSIYMRSATPRSNSYQEEPPSIEIELSTFPELDREVGDEVLFVVKGIITEKSLNENGRDKCIEVMVKEIGINREQSVEKQRDMWASRSSNRNIKSKSDAFADGLLGERPKTGTESGMTILNDADIQLNKMLAK